MQDNDGPPEDTQESLYHNKILPVGLEAIIEAVELVKKGKAPKIPQDRTLASYYPPCSEKYTTIDWVQPVMRIYNLIRGTYPVPGATTTQGDTIFKVLDSEPIIGYTSGKPGEIIELNGLGLKVSVPDGAILIKQVQVEGGERIAASAFSKRVNIKLGDMLG